MTGTGARLDASPTLSVVLVAYDMAREAPRTVRSFCRPYQRGDDGPLEVVVVDNGSPDPLRLTGTSETPVRVHRVPAPWSASPAAAVNRGVELAEGELVCVVVDGARMASPGLVHHARRAARLQDEPLVATLAWHLGPDEQPRSVLDGYDRAAEDRLLDGIGWPADGDALFDISVPAPASRRGYLLPLPESSALVMRKARFVELGGFDERFEQPGGGLVASDFFRRAVLAADEAPVVLVGEGTFHQLHAPPARLPMADLLEEYRAIRGEDFEPPAYQPTLYGRAGVGTAPFLGRSAVLAARVARHGTTEAEPRSVPPAPAVPVEGVA